MEMQLLISVFMIVIRMSSDDELVLVGTVGVPNPRIQISVNRAHCITT